MKQVIRTMVGTSLTVAVLMVVGCASVPKAELVGFKKVSMAVEGKAGRQLEIPYTYRWNQQPSTPIKQSLSCTVYDSKNAVAMQVSVPLVSADGDVKGVIRVAGASDDFGYGVGCRIR
jgi:hypothetical protein